LELTQKLQQARATSKVQIDKLKKIADGTDPDKALKDLREYVNRAGSQINNSIQASREEGKGVAIQDMDNTVRHWFNKQGREKRVNLLEDLYKDNAKLSLMKRIGKKEAGLPADFMLTCAAAGLKLQENGMWNMVYGPAKAVVDNFEKVKEATFFHDQMQSFFTNIAATSAQGNRYPESVKEFAASMKNKSSEGAYKLLHQNMSFPSWRHTQQLLRVQEVKTAAAGADKETIEYMSQHCSRVMVSAGFDESKINPTSIGKSGEANFGGAADNDFDKRQQLLKERLAAVEFGECQSDRELIGALQRFDDQLIKDQAAIRCVYTLHSINPKACVPVAD
jgi:hypothetical protein